MRKHFWLGTAVTLLILGVSVLSLGGGHGTLCSVASAQDNPCLAQEATNSALQVEVLGAQATRSALQVENVNLQATITALEAQVGFSGSVVSVPNTNVACQPYPVSETFDDNSRGISTISQDAGRARIVDGILDARYSGAEDRLFVLLPGACAQDNFYIEVTLQMLERGIDRTGGNFGLAIGNADQTDYHVFSINEDKVLIMDITGHERNETLVDGSYGDIIPNHGEDNVRLGLAGRNGIVTIYVNDEEYDAFPILFKGNSVALYIGSGGTLFDGTRISFDNFIIRPAR